MPAAAVAIAAHGLGKRFRISSSAPSATLGEALRSRTSDLLRRSFGSAPALARTTRDLWAVRDLSFEVKEGETVGLIGSNGSGKSTLLKIISRIVSPTTGEVRIRGRVGALLEVGTGFHPELTGRDNVFLNGAIIGMTANDIRRRFDEIVAFSGMQDFLELPIKRYSSGMVMRLAFAVAAHLEPDVLIIDEVLAVGDAEFQRKCLRRMDDVARSGCTVFFVSHNLAAVQRLCSRAILLDHGQMLADGRCADVIGQYLDRSALRAAPAEWTALAPLPREEHHPAIVAVRYGDPTRSASSPRSLGPITIDARIDSPLPMKAMLATDIRDELGNKLVNADCWTKANHQIDLPAGTSEWRFHIDQLYLEAGSYLIDLWLANSSGQPLDHRKMALKMDLLSADGLPAVTGRPAQENGLVACRFTLTRMDFDESRRAG